MVCLAASCFAWQKVSVLRFPKRTHQEGGARLLWIQHVPRTPECIGPSWPTLQTLCSLHCIGLAGICMHAASVELTLELYSSLTSRPQRLIPMIKDFIHLQRLQPSRNWKSVVTCSDCCDARWRPALLCPSCRSHEAQSV